MSKPPIRYARLSIGFNGSANEDLHLLYCEKQELQWIVKSSTELGHNDYEEVDCPYCGNKLAKGEGSFDGISTTATPEIIGCLIANKKRLVLVFSEYASEAEQEVVSEHLENLNLSRSYSLLGRHLSRSSFLKDCAAIKRNFLSKKFSIKFSRIKKLVEKRRESVIERLGKEQVKSTSLRLGKSQESKDLLAQIRLDYEKSKQKFKELNDEKKLRRPVKLLPSLKDLISTPTSNKGESPQSQTQNGLSESEHSSNGLTSRNPKVRRLRSELYSSFPSHQPEYPVRVVKMELKPPAGLKIKSILDWWLSEAIAI